MSPKLEIIRRFPQKRAILILSTLAILAGLGMGIGQIRADDPQPLSVKLIIDYNDGVEKHYTAIPWKQGMTIFDAMQQARRSAHGITFEYSGKGSTAFLKQIDDLKNEGGGEDNKNWILRVNKKLATQSFGIYELKAKDVVRWRFEKFKI